jgi:hypothetical protein
MSGERADGLENSRLRSAGGVVEAVLMGKILAVMNSVRVRKNRNLLQNLKW